MPRVSFYFIFFICFFATPHVPAQAESRPEAEQSKQQDAAENIQALISATEVAYQLRKNYGISGSVSLSKTLWQILNSYSNQQQAQNLWQSAINTVTNLPKEEAQSEPLTFDSRYHFGQILIHATHGMNSANWNNNLTGTRVTKASLKAFFDSFDDLTIYLQLEDVWQILLADIAKQETIQWDEVFLKSLNLFSQEPTEEKKALPKVPKKRTKNTQQKQKLDFSVFLRQWHNSDNKNELLAKLLAHNSVKSSTHRYFIHTMLQYLLEKKNQHFLAASLSWFSFSQQLYDHEPHYSTEQIKLIAAFLEIEDTWFLAHEAELLAVDMQLPAKIESNFHRLKAVFSQHEGDLNLNNDNEPHFSHLFELLLPSLDKYMHSPFRKEIMQNLEVCFNISEESLPLPQVPIEQDQFEGCLKEMFYAANDKAKSRELAGSLVKIDTQAALDRALKLPPWQNININYANNAKENCLQDSMQLVNPFEWSLAAESIIWFADRWPAYMQIYPHPNEMAEVIKNGQSLLDEPPCLEAQPDKILQDNFQQISQAWQNTKALSKKVVDEFMRNNLRVGSDIDLLGDMNSQSTYRVKDSKIAACDVQNACGVHLKLESSRALYALFPNHLLVADQLQMGSLKLCYDDVGWEKRRSAPTHLDNDNVANYYGHFSFSLKGYYDEKLVFERKITDKEEYLYLFAENSPIVQDTYCPLPIVGKKIPTKLKRGTFGLVPNRLTFLTASRVNETKIMQGNWQKGAEWINEILRDTALVVTENKLENLQAEVQQTYQLKAKQLQDTIYKSLLNRISTKSKAQQELYASFATMQRLTKKLYANIYLLKMNQLLNNDAIFGMFFGINRIFDAKTVQEFYENQNNISLLFSAIDKNIEKNSIRWNEWHNNLSKPYIANIIYRLSLIY